VAKFFPYFQRYSVYVLECENGKYYVGSTYRRQQRFKEHQSLRGGSKWTRLHKPIRILHEVRRIPTPYYLGMEATITAKYMLKYGINNVRGAMFSEPREYHLGDIDTLTKFLGHHNNLDYKEIDTLLQQVLPKDPTIIAITEKVVSSPENNTNAPWTSKKNKSRTKAPSTSNDICFKCGEKGHWAKDCPKH
jgi:predicted GIY-YIG superfamily endonuclease